MGRVLLALLALGALLALTLGLFATRGLTGGASTGAAAAIRAPTAR